MTIVERYIIPAFGYRRQMTNQDLYQIIRARAHRAGRRLTPNWKATIRNTLQRHAKGHPKCQSRKAALFIHRAPGLWELRNTTRR